jgi:hypothetical protein
MIHFFNKKAHSTNSMSRRTVALYSSKRKMHFWWLGSLLWIMMFALAACAGSASSANSSSDRVPGGPGNTSGGSSSSSASGSQQKSSPDHAQAQYLSKALSVTMQFKDTTSVASTLQNWIMNTDPRANSAGMDYEQVGGNAFNITLTFSVEASDYTKIQEYLGSYAQQNHGQLVSMKETVQDDSNDYVDSQSQLKNLRTEQTRIQGLMSQAQDLQDTLTLQDKLTGIEGQIEQIEEHINSLASQITYYPVTIILQPVLTTPQPAPTPTPGWSIGQPIHDAFVSSLSFSEWLLTVLIWILAFSVYLIPVALIALLWWRWHIGKLRIGSMSRMMPPTPHA